MRFALTGEQRELRSVLRDFLAKQAPLEEVPAQADGGVAFPPAAWDALAAELAVLGVDTPVEYGGIGLGAVELAVVSEELGAVACPGPFLSSIAMAAGVLQQAVAGGSAVARPFLPTNDSCGNRGWKSSTHASPSGMTSAVATCPLLGPSVAHDCLRAHEICVLR